MKTPIAAAAAACKVWARSTAPCIFGRSVYETLRTTNNIGENKDLANSTLSVASQLPPTYHCDRMLVDFEEKDDGSVVLTPLEFANEEEGRTTETEANTRTKRYRIPLGRARDCPTLTPRALEDDKFDRRRRPFVSLAVVGMVVVADEDNDGESSSGDTDALSLLITRRPSYMRSFPGAFVFPGGNVDPDDESLEDALSREIFEETGLEISKDSWKLECLWESIYPTQISPTIEASDIDTVEQHYEEGAIKAHHLVCYFSGRPQNQDQRKIQESLTLCEEEVDGAVWMSRDKIRDLLEATASIERDRDRALPEIVADQTISLHASGNMGTNPIPLSDLAGIYPRVVNSDCRFCGMAQGSLFALEEFVRNHPTQPL